MRLSVWPVLCIGLLHACVAAALPPGIIAVTPASGAADVSIDTTLSLDFPVAATFAYTDNRKLRVIETATNIEVFAIDPDASDAQSGNSQYLVTLPSGTLKPDTGYHVTLDQGFAAINQAPWKTGAHDGSEWFFSTAPLAAANPGVANIDLVFPAPGANGVPVNTSIEVTYPAPANYAYTEDRFLIVRDTQTQVVVFEADPEVTDSQNGATQYVVTPPAGALQPGRTYDVSVDYAFAGINVAPWKTGAIHPGSWQFTTAAAVSAAPSVQVDGLLAVSPAPGASHVDPTTTLTLQFSADLSFANTDNSTLRIVDVATQQERFSIDPDEAHIDNGARTLTVTLPAGTLNENTTYDVLLDYQFARFNAAPWRSTTLSAGAWSFTTGAHSPAPLASATNGITAVYPAPGSTEVSPDVAIEVHFAARSMFGYTEGSSLAIIDTRDNSTVASIDPAYLDPQEGMFSFTLNTPSALQPGVDYRAELDYSFARFNAEPWVSADTDWTFTVAGIAAQPDPAPTPEPDPSPDPSPVTDPGTADPDPGSDPAPTPEPAPSPQPPTTPIVASTTGTVMFVTQTPVSGVAFGTVINHFSNHVARSHLAPRGGDLWIRYADGSLRNLTQEAGFGENGLQGAGAIAVRRPSVHWDGDRALFSMIVGSPSLYETTDYFWQIYEVTGLEQGQTATITKVPNQPQDYNNVSAIYAATGDDIIFVSDMTHGGRHLYPQYEEYDGAATNTGLFRLTPASGELTRLTHAPSGDFTPIIDDFGRLIFVRWDHLQQDQQNGTLIGGVERFGAAVNFVDESVGAPLDTTNGPVEVFPEHLVQVNPETGVPFVVGNETGHRFNQFFLWESSPVDGSHNEVLNHLGRQELGMSYTRGRFVDDSSLTDITTSILGGHTANTVPILAPGGTFHPMEDPNQPGAFYMTHAQEFAFCGEILYVEAAPSINPEDIAFQKVTEYFGADPIDGCYRNPLPLADDVLVAAWSPFDFGNEQGEGGGFRLRFVNADGTPGAFLTSGIDETVSYYNPDFLINHTGNLWELDPVEVRPRTRPASVLTQNTTLEHPEQLACEAAFGSTEACNNGMSALRSYLADNKLALVVSRNVTLRDDSDTQQPFNLRVPGGTTADTSFGNDTVYDVTHLQFLQANLVRGYTNRPNGRRPLAQFMSDSLASGLNNSLEGAVEIGNDGSVVAVVPAERAVTWHLVDEAQGNRSVVSERYWVNFAAGEVRVCANCHGINDEDQMGNPPPQNTPQALTEFLTRWLQQTANPS